MSGDVQPRKRKDKRKKKDELGLEEPRGTSAALGEGDVFMHSQHEHGTGGHWCAKIIFFSLLAVLITLIGLIILENRGLTELEANSVESKYSGVLEGWIEDAPEDDHYDEHTLDLKHPEDNDEVDVHKSGHDEDDDDDHETPNDHEHEEGDDDEEEEEDDEEEEEDDEHNQDDDEGIESNEIDSNDGDDNDGDSEENVEETEEVEERVPYRQYSYKEKYNTYDDDDDDDDNDDDDEENNEDDVENGQFEEDNENLNDDEDDVASDERDDDDDEDDVDDDNIDEDSAKSVVAGESDEKNDADDDNNEEYDQAGSDEDDIEEQIVQEDADDGDDDDEIEKIEAEKSDEIGKQDASEEDDDDNDNNAFEDDDDEPPVEKITTPPAGKPFVEIEEETTEKPVDTLAEEVEYERRQEELRKEKEEQGSQMWLKLAVGGALLVATHAVLRRATARDAPEPEDRSREETPSTADRRMTLIPDEPVVQQSQISSIRPIADDEVFKKPAPVFKNEPIFKPNILEEVKEKKVVVEESKPIEKVQEYEEDDEEKELYSDEEEIVEEEEEEEDIEEPPKVTPQQKNQPAAKEDSEPEEVPDDVEIINDEQIEEEIEDEEEDEEEISDVDDAELLSRLEAKYGRLPEPERFGRQKDGGNSIEDEWPGEPLEPYWREQLDIAEEELRQGALESCEKRVSAPKLSDSGRAKWILAQALDVSAEAKRDNKLLSKAISAYLNLLKMNERLSDRKLVEIAQRTIDRIQFRGTYLNAEPIYRLLIRRFPQDVNYRNNLTISFLMANRADLADEVLRETLKLWPNDRVALAHHGFVLKNQYNKLEEAVVALQKALEGDTGPANEPRFYYHLGDALLLLGRFEEAHQVHVRGAKLGHFLSPAQRSLYNVPRLRSRPWWPVEETPYVKLARTLEKSWREILKEAEDAKELYEQEKEGLKEKGEWSQLDVFVRGRELPGRCARAPVTCAVVRAEAAAARCRRGQVKFSALAAGTHVRAHVGPTNCRLRMHLALSNTSNTFIRVDKEIRQWELGKTFIFDDSFEHEVWHNGTGTRLVLIVDLWHPDLTPQERSTLPAI